MSKKTSSDLSTELGLLLEDPNSTNFKAAFRADVMTEAQNFLQARLLSLSKKALAIDEWNKKLLEYGDFSGGDNWITAPGDMLIPVRMKKEGSPDFAGFVREERIDDEDLADYASFTMFACECSAPLPDSANTGTDSIELWPDYSGAATLNYVVEMDGTTTFRWSDDGGSTWDESTVATATTWTDLNNGLKVKFGGASGFTVGDKWAFTAYHDRMVQIIKTNFNPDTNWHLVYAEILAEITSIADTVYLPYERYYDALKKYCQLMCMARDEQDVSLDSYVYAPVEKRVMEIAQNSVDQDLTMKPGKNYTYYV